MTNIAYTDKYQNYRKEWDIVFAAENLTTTESQHAERAKGMENYHIERSYYKVDNEGVKLWGAETTVFDENGAAVYRYKTDDDDGDFLTLIKHSNGGEYFLFRTGLYGYGVYDLAAKQSFIYIPDAAETFIWTDVHYNPITNMLAVHGCFWACPFGVILLDFAKPMQETEWVDVISALDGGYDTYDGLDFIRWQGADLILKANEIIEENGKTTSKPTEIEIAATQYREWFKKSNGL